MIIKSIAKGTPVSVRKPNGTVTDYIIREAIVIPEKAEYVIKEGVNGYHVFSFKGYVIEVSEVYVMRRTTKNDRPEGHCDRCNGKGNIACYRHVQGGVCFKCGGTGNTLIKPVVD